MIALDTNILVHAHRRDSELHERAFDVVKALAESQAPWAIPAHCQVELYGIVTHGGIWRRPSTPAEAVRQIQAWRRSPSLRLLGDEGTTMDRLLVLAEQARVAGAKVHDARIAATCLSHGVSELWSVDRDFSRFPELRTRNPLL